MWLGTHMFLDGVRVELHLHEVWAMRDGMEPRRVGCMVKDRDRWLCRYGLHDEPWRVDSIDAGLMSFESAARHAMAEQEVR